MIIYLAREFPDDNRTRTPSSSSAIFNKQWVQQISGRHDVRLHLKATIKEHFGDSCLHRVSTCCCCHRVHFLSDIKYSMEMTGFCPSASLHNKRRGPIILISYPLYHLSVARHLSGPLIFSGNGSLVTIFRHTPHAVQLVAVDRAFRRTS